MKASREAIKQAVLWTAQNTPLVPTLWGPTASGKTWMIRELAEELDAKMWVVLLSSSNPDDVTGFPTIGPDGNITDQLSHWARDMQAHLEADESHKAVVFMDELGLAREEVRATMYTFMRDRLIKSYDFSKYGNRLLVFAATNQADFEPPYLSRCLFFDVPQDRDYLHEMSKNSISEYAARSGMIESKYEQPPAAKYVTASMIDVINKFTERSFISLETETRELIIRGLVPMDIAETILRMTTVGTVDSADPVYLAHDKAVLLKTLEILNPVEATSLFRHQIIPVLIDESQDFEDGEREETFADALAVLYAEPEKLVAYLSDESSQEIANQFVEVMDAKKLNDYFAAHHIRPNPNKGGVLEGPMMDSFKRAVEYYEAIEKGK